MEKRKIVIMSTRTQDSKVIMSGAETLRELKKDCDLAGIDYSGLVFNEGVSKTELLNDDSQLPKDVLYKGAVTNNLVFVLTVGEKKTVSGGMNREDLYKYIRQNLLQEDIRKKLGKNFTNCKTEELEKFVNKHYDAENTNKTSKKENKKTEVKEEKDDKKEAQDDFTKKIFMFIDIIRCVNALTKAHEAEHEKEVPSEKTAKIDSPYNDDELDDLVGSLEK